MIISSSIPSLDIICLRAIGDRGERKEQEGDKLGWFTCLSNWSTSCWCWISWICELLKECIILLLKSVEYSKTLTRFEIFDMLWRNLSNFKQTNRTLVIYEEMRYGSYRGKLWTLPIKVPPLISALVLSVTSIKNSAPVSIMCCKMLSSTLNQMRIQILWRFFLWTYTAPKLSELDTKRYSLPSANSWSKTPEWRSALYRSPWPGGYQLFLSSSARFGQGRRVSLKIRG